MHWKSLLSAFVSVGRLILRLFAFIWSAIRYLVGAVFGVLNWQRPAWLGFITSSLRSYWQWCRSHPRHMTTSIGWIMIAVGSFLWYQSLPKPVTVSFSVDAPGLTVFENQQWRIANLDIYFEDSVAPLANIDTVITSGVSMSPKIDGEWRWLSGRQLRFIPRTDWQIAQTYKIRFDKSKWLADNTVLNTYQAEFTTPEFTTQLESNQFYLDPIDPTQKKMVATFAFSHPVNQSSFEKRLTFKLADGLKFLNKDAAPLSISYDKEKLHAYVHSAALETPREDLAMKLLLDDGVTAERGSNKTDSDIDSSITVPGRSSLRFSDFAMNIVDNERFEPVQLLNFSSSAPMSEKALTGQIRAWLLPEFPSDYKGSRSEPYSWDQEHVSEAILKAAPALPLGYQAGEQEYNDQHGFTFSAPVGRYVYALIPAGVQAFGGYDALKPTGYLFPVKPYPTVLKLMSEGALLTANGSKKIAYVSRGVNAVRYEVGRLLPNQLHHMMADHQNNLATPYVSDDRFNSLVERFTEIQPTPGTDPTKAYIQNIDLNKYLYTKDGRKRGIFVLRIREAERTDKPEDKNYDYGGDGRLIVVTDLGVVAKRTMNGDYDLYVMSLATGKPVEAARVELVGLNGMAVASDNTDSSGHASITMQQNWLREKTPLMFVINKDDDTSFLPLNRDDRNLDFSRFDIGGIENAESGKQLSAYAFTDRNLYRPGETAHLMYIVRTADWQGELQGLPLEVEVTDPRGLVVQRSRIALSRAGFDGLDFVSSAASLTGDYQFTISIIRNNNEHERLGGSSFSVREFEPDRLKVHAALATSANDGWVKPEDVHAQVQVMHLFGNPASAARVDGELTLSGGINGFSKFSDYSFRDPGKPLQAPVTEKLADTTTDDNGEASFDLNLKRFDKASYRAHILTRAFEPGSGRSVNAQASVLVSSAAYLVGVKTDGALNYISRGSKRTANWLAIDPRLQVTTADGLALQWIERRSVSVLARQDDGTYRYVSRLKENLRDSKTTKIPVSGLQLELATEQPGDYSYVLRNGAGDIVSRLDYSVSGNANLSRTMERNAELQLSLSSSEVKPGDSLEISIRAPYAGAGLITIERDKVLAHSWFQSSTSSSVQHITVPKNLEGTAYINVQFVRDINSDEIYTSPLSYGVLPFTVNVEARRQAATLTAAARVKPGENLAIKLDTTEAVRAAVIVVDEGILQVAKFETPDPIGFFFQKRRLQVNTSQILDLILPEFERLMKSAPGGDDENLLQQQLNPFKKKGRPPVAWWSGVKDIPAGVNTFDYAVPDSFNGKLRIYSVIATAGKISAHEIGTEVQGDLILTPNVPMAAAPGDELVVTLGVYNNLKGKGKQTIKVRALTDKGLKIIGKDNLSFVVDEGQEAVAEYRVKLTETLGSAAIRFEAESGDARAKISDSISVRPATPYRTVLNTGSFDASNFSVPVTRKLYTEFRGVNAGLAPSPLIWAQGLSTYLGNYPYSCTEQITSQAIPALILKQHPELGKNSVDMDAVIRTLRSRQNDAGGFGLWAANPVVENYVSLHVTQFLIEAKAKGENIPDDMLRSAMEYVQSISGTSDNGFSSVRERAYAIYLLARQGINPAAQIASLKADLDERYKKQWQDDLTAAYLAATYSLLKQDDQAWQLMKAVSWRTQKSWLGGDNVYNDPLIHDAVHLHLLARHFSSHINTVPDNLTDSLGKLLSEQRFNSLSAGLLLLALDQYHIAGGEKIGNLTINELNAAGKTKNLPFNSGSLQRVDVSTDAKKLALNRSGKGRAFYVLAEAGFDRSSPAAINKGLELERDFVDAEDKPLSSVSVGDEFYVRLRIRGTAYDDSPQIAIVDLLPGGLEPVPQLSEAQTVQQDECYDDECAENDGEDYGEESDSEQNQQWQSPLGVTADGGWAMQYADVRDDRVVLYGNLTGRDVITIKYRVRAINPGSFQTPAPYAEGMYDRALYVIGKVGKLEVTKPE